MDANLKYDYSQFVRHEVPLYVISDIIRQKKSDSHGLSLVFNDLCEYAGIPGFIVEGYYLGGWNRKGDAFIRTNHWWNIYYDGMRWITIDFAHRQGYFVRPGDTIEGLRVPGVQSLIWVAKSVRHSEGLFETHLAADPAMQLSDRPVLPGCFAINYPYDDTCRGPYQNFADTLKKMMRLHPAEAYFQSAHRAFGLNPANYRIIGMATMDLGKHILTQQADDARPDSTQLIKVRKMLLQASQYLLLEKDQIRNENKNKVLAIKDYFKPFHKEYANYIRLNTKLIEKNNRNIDKARQRKATLEQTIKKIKQTNLELLADEKILDVERPKAETSVEDEYLIIDLLKQYRANADKIGRIRDNIQEIYDAGNNQLLAVYREVQLESGAMYAEKQQSLAALIELLGYQNPGLHNEIDEKRFAVHSISEHLRKNREAGNYMGGDSFKENNRELKSTYGELQTLMKVNKNILKEIKKRSFEDRNEEELYMVENQTLADENAAMVLRYEATIAQIATEVENMKGENRRLKGEIKLYKSIVKGIIACRESENDEEAQRYLFEKNFNKLSVKTCNSLISECNKLFGKSGFAIP